MTFTAGLAGVGGSAVEAFKAPKTLAGILPADQTKREVRIASFEYFQPSLVFYCRRQVQYLKSEHAAVQFLQGPHTAYLFVPAAVWEKMAPAAGTAVRSSARCYDLYDKCDIVLIEARHDDGPIQ